MTSAPGTQDDARTRASDHSGDGTVTHRVALVTGGRHGLATMCGGGGQGIAAIFERL